MKFPVFLLGLVVVSAGIGTILWILDVSASMSVLWAVITFGVGQVMYVLLIAVLAVMDRKSAHGAPKVQETAGVSAARRLAAKHDQQV